MGKEGLARCGKKEALSVLCLNDCVGGGGADSRSLVLLSEYNRCCMRNRHCMHTAGVNLVLENAGVKIDSNTGRDTCRSRGLIACVDFEVELQEIELGSIRVGNTICRDRGLGLTYPNHVGWTTYLASNGAIIFPAIELKHSESEEAYLDFLDLRPTLSTQYLGYD